MIDFHFDGVQLSKVVCHHLYGFCVFHVLLLQDLIVDVLFDPNLELTQGLPNSCIHRTMGQDAGLQGFCIF